ncbi:MAG: haloalkane dehalogenase [Myxococcota bacterium]|jgi:haloalkane dehalogenase
MTRLLPIALLVLVSTGCMKIMPGLMPKVATEANISADFPYESHTVEVLDSTMHYIDEGAGLTMVLVHGNPTSTYLWRNVIPHLSADHRVVAVDLIGMGKSGKPDIDYRFADHIRYFDAFIQALDLEDVVFILHDWGGGIGFDHALRNPDNVRGVAFFEAVVTPFSWGPMSPPERFLFKKLRGPAGDRLMMEDNYFVERLIPAMSGRKFTDQEMEAYRAPYAEEAHRKPTRVWPQEVPLDGDPSDNHERVAATYEKLKASRVPLLMLVGDPGAIMRPELVEQLQTELLGLDAVTRAAVERCADRWATPDVGCGAPRSRSARCLRTSHVLPT